MILASIFGFVSGIFVGSLVHFSLWVILTILAVAFLFFFYRFFLEARNKFYIAVISIFLFSAVIGIVRISISNLYSVSKLQNFVGQNILAEGVIVSEPDVRESNTKLTIRIEKIISVEAKPCSELCSTTGENILLTVPIYPELHYGDRVKFQTLLKEPQNVESDDGRVFDYGGYLRVRGIWFTGSFAKVEFISSGNGNMVKDLLFKIKHAFTNSINNALPEPESSLLSGLLLGSKQSLGKDLLSEFQRTGVSHIVVLSGYNIAIVAESIMDFFKFLPKNISFGFGVLGIVLFTILSGGGASAWRAAIMVLVALSAKKLNRDYKAGRILGFVIIIMLAPNPLLLAFDPSFQLSILATIGLIFVSPLISPHLTKITEKFGLREIISTTVATQITVLPFLIYNTGVLSLVSLPVNVLILSTIPLTMLLGFITGISGLIWLYLSYIPAFFTYLLLWYQLKVVHLGSNLSYGAVTLPAFSPLVLIMVYLTILIGLLYLKKKTIYRS